MFKWAAIFLILAIAGGCLNAMGVGANTLTKLTLALSLMACASLLIAWPFLRNKTGP